jgi:hypothetical protein
MKRKHDSYGGFQPLEVKLSNDYYSTNEYNLLKYNSAKAALRVFLEKTEIRTIYVPLYLCPNVCREIESHNIRVIYYRIDHNLLPMLDHVVEDSWVYIVDYFGVMDGRVDAYIAEHGEMQFILDNCHSFFHKPNIGKNYIYSCKKFFGVPDGAYLITDEYVECQQKFSRGSEYASYLLTCLESGTDFCYQEKKKVDQYLGDNYDAMSKIADILMHSIDYEYVAQRRHDNAMIYEDAFAKKNRICIEKDSVPYMYPLNVGKNIKNELIQEKIFVPTLWAHCGKMEYKGTWEYDLTENTLFLPVDQRYDTADISYIVSVIEKMM